MSCSKSATLKFVFSMMLMPSNDFENLSLQPRHLRIQGVLKLHTILSPARACVNRLKCSTFSQTFLSAAKGFLDHKLAMLEVVNKDRQQ